MTLKINENNITKIASFDSRLVLYAYHFCIDWVARNLYFEFKESSYYNFKAQANIMVKLDLTMWENGIIKFDEIFKSNISNYGLNVLPSMGYVYYRSPEKIIFH